LTAALLVNFRRSNCSSLLPATIGDLKRESRCHSHASFKQSAKPSQIAWRLCHVGPEGIAPIIATRVRAHHIQSPDRKKEFPSGSQTRPKGSSVAWADSTERNKYDGCENTQTHEHGAPQKHWPHAGIVLRRANFVSMKEFPPGSKFDQ
jgi:hypothetical protein